MKERRSSKRELVEGMLDAGMVMVTLDARAPGVDVPSRFRDDPHLSLNLSYRFGRSLDLEEWGIEAELTFGGVPHRCRLPWSSIYQAYSHVSGEQLLFPADLPMDLIEALEVQRTAKDESSGPRSPVLAEAEPLRAAEGEESSGSAAESLSDEERKDIAYEILFGTERPPERPALRVVEGGVTQPPDTDSEPSESPPRPSYLRRIK